MELYSPRWLVYYYLIDYQASSTDITNHRVRDSLAWEARMVGMIRIRRFVSAKALHDVDAWNSTLTLPTEG